MGRFWLLIGVLLPLACGGSSTPPPGGDDGGSDGGLGQVAPPLKCAPNFIAPGPGPRFRDVTVAWGLSDVRAGRVSVGDLDGDGYPDVIVHRTGTHNRNDFTKPAKDWTYRVFLNKAGFGGGRQFQDHTRASGYGAVRTGGSDVGRAAHFAVMGDLDGDGDIDIFSGTYADRTKPDTDPGDRSEVLLNDGTGHFTLAARNGAFGEGDPNRAMPTTAATLLDDNRDGHLDVFVGHWYDRYGQSYDGVQDRLVYGYGDGTFTDVTSVTGLVTANSAPNFLDSPRPTYGVTACDLDGNGRTDLLTSAYGRRWNQLLLRDSGSFRDVGATVGFAGDKLTDFGDNEFYRCYCAQTQRCTAAAPRITCDGINWGAGADEQPWRLNGNTFTTACGDIDNDGDMDLYNAEIVHWHIGSSSDPSELILNEGVGGLSGLILRRPGRATTGLAVPRVGASWNEGGIGAGIADLDNDGRPDILLGTSDYPDQYLWVYHQQPNGTFREVGEAAGLHHPCAPSFSFADLDRDGDLDIIVTSSTARSWCSAMWPDGPEVRVYENLTGQDANWTQIRLVGRGASVGGANRSAIGAVVKVTAGGITRTREVQGGYGHFGMQHDLDVTVGLGETCLIEAVEVRWPDGASSRERFEGVRANYPITIEQGVGLRYRPTP